MKNNKKLIKMIIITTLCILASFYIIYKLSSSIFMVVSGAIILLIGLFVKDPEISKVKEETNNLEQLTIFSNEVLEPAIINHKEKVVAVEKKRKKKASTVIDIENTNSYKFDEIDKKIRTKSKKVKA